MDTSTNSREDPLIAALPPATDYLTYLTLLEYQLKPDNLSTLNKLLSDDDGTLASEIGWDLLKLVLPMLQIVPEEANTCLGIIARRGNPREVVVRIAEELERLSRQEGESETEDEDGLDEDGLPTFPGEAPRIHLGEMKLDGMPPTRHEQLQPKPSEAAGTERRVSTGAESGSDNVLILTALLSMLGILHPRIKTQYPSRFLATSLPAALDAYRSMSVTAETTLAFVEFLSKLSGKQRPALPPRISTAANIPRATLDPATASTTGVQAPPLPDPEAKSDLSSGNAASQATERAITKRLLQAVMLEVLDEYTNSFQSTEQPCMSWTIRLREKHEPKRVLPNKPTETQRWTQSAELNSRDKVVAKFLKVARDLNLQIGAEIGELVDPTSGEDLSSIEQPESDYPTSPSQIPFPVSGLILLFAAQNFAQDVTGLTGAPPVSFAAIRTIFRSTFAPVQDLPHPPSLSQTDALLSLIYLTLQSPLSQPPPSQPDKSSTSQIDLPFLTNLTTLFTTSPDPLIRDSTHHLTTLLLHNHTASDVKLLYLESLLSPRLTSASPIHDIQQGNLRALAVNWLKDEFISNSNTNSNSTTESSAGAGTDSRIPIQPPPLPSSIHTDTGLDPKILHTDPELSALVFPAIPNAPNPFISSHPAASSSTSAATQPVATEADLETLLLQLPSHIASLNLLCVLASLPSTTSDADSTLNSVGSAPNIILQYARPFLQSLTAWKDLLVNLADGVAKNKAAQAGNSGPINISDVYALEDAVARATGVLDRFSDEE